MSEQIRQYEIENVGGVKRAHLELRPGVSVLTGANGIGKTSSIRAIARAEGGEVELERRDGTEYGTVRGPGVQLRVGKVVRRTGQAELSLCDVAPLSRLIDPQIADTDAAARARIRALIELLGLALDDGVIEILCGRDAELGEWLRAEIQAHAIEDVMVAAERLARELHRRARAAEAEAEQAHGQSVAAVLRVEGLDALLGDERANTHTSVVEARAALAEAGGKYERALAQAEAREDLEARQTALGKTLGDRPDTSVALESLKEAQLLAERAAAQCIRLEEELAVARERSTAARDAEIRVRKEADSVSLRAGKWDEAQKVLAQPVEGPTRGELAEIREQTIGAAEKRLDLAQQSADYQAARAERAEADESSAAWAKDGAELRAAAAALPARLGEILAASGAPGLTVESGRLCAVVDGKTLDFEKRLSSGQQVRAALDIAVHCYGAGVVPISGEHWQSLDPENRTELAAEAAKRGLYVITEQPDGGELRVEHLGAEPEAAA